MNPPPRKKRRIQSTHSNERFQPGINLKCSISSCIHNDVFRFHSHFKKHMKTIHGDTKPYHCNRCDKSYVTKASLTVHERIHTGIKPFSCDECGQMFTQKSNLTTHERTHADIRPFSCDECGQTFVGKADLTVHERTHSGIRPFKCDECGQTFIRKGI